MVQGFIFSNSFFRFRWFLCAMELLHDEEQYFFLVDVVLTKNHLSQLGFSHLRYSSKPGLIL